MDFPLHEKQSFAVQSPATEILFGGAAGPGKSHLIRAAACMWAAQIPGLQIYLFRRTFPDLWKNHMEGPNGFPNMLVNEIQNNNVKINYGKNTIEYWNGSKIFLCHCQHEKDMYNYQGAEIHVLLIDELTHFTDKIYRYLRGRVRMIGIELPQQFKNMFPRVLNGSNPGGVGHNWVKQTFVDYTSPYKVKRTLKKDGGMFRQYIPALLSDNPSLLKDDPDYVNRLQGLGDEALVAAMSKGDWDIVAGGMFDDLWDREIHVIIPFEIPYSWKIDRTFDWGSSKPFSVGWWAESDGTEATLRNGTKRSWPKGTLFRIAEWYGWNGEANKGLKMSNSGIAEGIKKREHILGITNRVIPGAADSSIYDNEGGNCIATDMELTGIQWMKANKSPGSRSIGWQLLRDRLQASLKMPMEEKGIFIFNICSAGFIRTIPVLPRDKIKTDDVDTDSEDHTGDEVRYRLLAKKPAEIEMQKIIGL